jgi:DNA polymerase-3 subunit alpha (Gram-positive type)
MWLKLRGRVEYDRFMNPPELVIVPLDVNEVVPPAERSDDAPEKRVEFHLHTTMSTMDAVTSAEEYIKTAAKWGHKAIAITDHSGVQAFPEAGKAADKYGIKVIYGVEANVVNDGVAIVLNSRDEPLAEAVYVVFDIETTGLSVINNKIIEIAAVKMKDGKVIDRFATFVNPHEKIPYHIQQLTNITDEMVQGAPDVTEVLPRFVEFVGNAVQFETVGHGPAAESGAGYVGNGQAAASFVEKSSAQYPCREIPGQPGKPSPGD